MTKKQLTTGRLETMTAGKTLLIISGGIEAADAARRAKEMGLSVVMSDGDPEAPGFAFADSCLIANAHAPAELAAAAERYNRKIRKIDGVIAIAVGTPVTAATVAQRLRLPGLPLHVAELAADRLAMKKSFVSAGVTSPWAAEVRTPQELQRIVISHGRDLVIKPVDGPDSQGVQRIGGMEDLAGAFLQARSHSPTERVMVEKYLEGPQLLCETLVMGGRCFTPAFCDRNYEYLERYSPFFIDNGGELPSQMPQEMQVRMRKLVARAAGALGLSDVTFQSSLVVHQGEPHLIGLAARLSGGLFCSRQIPLHCGVDFIGAAIKIALGEPVSDSDLTPRHVTPVVQRYAFPKPGKVVRVTGLESARKLPGIAEAVAASPGDAVCFDGDVGAMILASGSGREAALRAAHDALAQIQVETA
jgi:biotin carboxylase